MDANTVLALGLGVTPPWRLVDQRLETGKQPHELHLEVAADRGSLFPCPVCGKPCKAHEFAEFTWRHLNVFQHHGYITAKIPRTDCDEHGVLRITAPWAREGSRFTLLFEQAALMLVREMPVLAAARIIEITDKRLWRIVEPCVGRAVERLDLRKLAAVGLDETAAKRGHTYVTVFIDLDRSEKPVVFVTPGHGKETVVKFRAFLAKHGGSPHRRGGLRHERRVHRRRGRELRKRCGHRGLVPCRATVHQGGRRGAPRSAAGFRTTKITPAFGALVNVAPSKPAKATACSMPGRLMMMLCREFRHKYARVRVYCGENDGKAKYMSFAGRHSSSWRAPKPEPPAQSHLAG